MKVILLNITIEQVNCYVVITSCLRIPHLKKNYLI